MTGKKAAAVEALKAYNADHGQGFHPSVTCDGTQQSPLFGWRYKHKGRNHNLCEAEFNKLPDAEKANYKKMMPPRWWDEEAQKRKAEAEVQKHLARIWQEREKRDIEREPSLVEIPRILFRKKPGGSAQSTQSAQSSQSSLLQELEKHARRRLKTQMSDMVLKHAQLEKLWSLLKRNASQPQNPGAHADRHSSPKPLRASRLLAQLATQLLAHEPVRAHAHAQPTSGSTGTTSLRSQRQCTPQLATPAS